MAKQCVDKYKNFAYCINAFCAIIVMYIINCGVYLLEVLFCNTKARYGFGLARMRSSASFVAGLLTAGVFSVLFGASTVHATAVPSTLTILVSDHALTASPLPGTFGISSSATISVNTTNYTGYTLSVAAADSTNLVSENDDVIPSMTGAPISQATYTSSSAYNNTFGFKPSQYIDSSTGDVVSDNSNYMPVPTTTGIKLDETSAPNSVDNTYTISYGVKPAGNQPPGTYVYEYIISAVGHETAFNITYDDNDGGDIVTNMPTPNPQPVSINAGEEDSYATLSSSVPVKDGYDFGGWCSEVPVIDSVSSNQTCNGDTYIAGSNYEIDQTSANTNITLYAIWIDDPFPVVWNQMGACEFHGATNGNITGTECTKYHNDKFIDTGVALYNQLNSQKDYEIHFTIVHYDPAEQADYYLAADGDSGDHSQQTFVNDKLNSTAGDKRAPGIVVRREDGTNIEINSKLNSTHESEARNYASMQDISVFRLDGKIYYSINGAPLEFLHDITGFNQYFGLTTWFGAAPRDNCTGDNGPCVNGKRIPEATLSNMYVRLGEYTDEHIHEITFNSNTGNTSTTTTYMVKHGNALTTLPADPTYDSDHVFDGWYTSQNDGTEISASTVPDRTTTYWAHWKLTVNLANITNTEITLDPNDTETINVTNAADLESYTFSSDNTAVATVNSDTGEITAVAPGTATITMTGNSGATRTITVTVAGQIYTVEFDTQGGAPVVNDIEVADGGSIDPLPETYKSGHTLAGWYSNADGTGTQLTTSTVFDSNTPLKYYAKWVEISYVCKPGKLQHVETCNSSSNVGCRAAGYSTGDPIYYGSIIAATVSTPTAGNAFTCDINDDGYFDETAERFYYFGMNGNNAKLVYYNSINNDENYYNDSLLLLPTSTTTGWTNSHLVKYTSSDYDGYFTDRVARFMMRDEAVAACNNSTSNLGSNGRCLYLLEKANFAVTSVIRDGYWLGGDPHDNQSRYYRLHTSSRAINLGSKNGTRPVIEVPMEYVSLEVEVPDKVTVTYNANGGEAVSSVEVDTNTAIGTLPTTTRTGYKFFGWYTDDGTFYEEVTPETVVSADITYHARWIEDTTDYPIVWSEINACWFNGTTNGAPNNISGTYCTQDKTKSYIDTAVALFSTANYRKDFEIGFTIVEYDPSAQTGQSQATILNVKRENEATGYPGFVVRRNGNNLQLTGRFSHGNPTDYLPSANSVKRMRIVREGGVLKYAINNNNLTTWYDVNNNIHRIDTTVWFGAAISSDDVNPQRNVRATLTDMYVKLKNEYTITFNAGAGSVSETSRSVTVGDPVGNLPTPTPPNANYTFGGWYNEQNALVSDGTQYIPTGNETLTARWNYQSSDTPMTFNVANNALLGYQTLIDSWAASPINITMFNKTSPINDSTWGDTTELSETQFWSDLRSNFTTNNCMVPSYGDATPTSVNTPAWANGTVDCSKPAAYNTGIDAPLDVYLYDTSTSTKGAQVAYAKADDGIIYNMIPGQTYKWEKSDDSTVYGYVTATSTKGRRFVDMGEIRNARDLGGLSVTYTDGNNQTVTDTLEYGRLFRGERLWNESATELTNLGINKEYDLTDGTETSGDTTLTGSYVLEQVKHYNFDYNTGDEDNPSSNYMLAWNAVTDIMTDIVNNKNIYFHCRVGADRTGTVAYLLEGLLGVSDEDRYEEYALTHLSGLYDRTRYYKEKVGGSAAYGPTNKFGFMMDYVLTKQDIYNWYMKNPSADASLIQSFRTAMTTPVVQQNNSNSAPSNNLSNTMSNGIQSLSGTRSLAVNNTDTGNTDSKEQEITKNVSMDDASDGETSETYGDPLGVSSASNGTRKNAATSPPTVAAAIAIMSAATIGGVIYSMAKQE